MPYLLLDSFPFLLQSNFAKTSGNPSETLHALQLSLAVPIFTPTLVYSPCYSWEVWHRLRSHSWISPPLIVLSFLVIWGLLAFGGGQSGKTHVALLRVTFYMSNVKYHTLQKKPTILKLRYQNIKTTSMRYNNNTFNVLLMFYTARSNIRSNTDHHFQFTMIISDVSKNPRL